MRETQESQEETSQEKKIIAELTKWNGKVETLVIERAWIDIIVTAIEAQFTIANTELGFCIEGGNYCHVDIYEVNSNDID